MVSAALDVYRQPDAPSPLQLGGDTGLRGYPLARAGGRSLATLEQRLYSDWYPYRLFRVGGAAFTDCGRDGTAPTKAPATTRSVRSVGLRLLSARSAFGNVAHIDFAFPLNNRATCGR